MEAGKRVGEEEKGRRRDKTVSSTSPLVVGTAAVATVTLAGCGTVQNQLNRVTGATKPEFAPLPTDNAKLTAAVNVLNRVGFGARPGDVARVAEMGAAGWIEEQLGSVQYKEIEEGLFSNYQQQIFGTPERFKPVETFPDHPAVAWRVNALDTQQMQQDAPERLHDTPDEQLVIETQQAVILRGVYSKFQLRETLADFWTNHFNLYALKLDGRILIPVEIERTIRQFALFNFREMLVHSAHSPAMLQYLDNKENKKGVANENYARELLELHSVGVKSGYTLRDIQEVARAFTGWTIKEGFQRGQFMFNRNQHDQGEKFIPFLNLRLVPNGNQKDGDAILEKLAMHPATARFLSAKLCRRYLGHAPEAIVVRAANAYLKNDTDIKAMLRPILLDGLAQQNDTQPIMKRPLDFCISALRATGADTYGGEGVIRHLEAMGQPLYQWPMPDGFPEKAAAWTGSLLPRWNFALALASNALADTTVNLGEIVEAFGAKTDAQRRDALAQVLLPGAMTNAIAAPIDAHVAKARQSGLPEQAILAETAALLMASPAFQYKGC